MDCIQTQEVLSQAADRTPVDAGLLREAKQHCASCAECATFVRGLAKLHQMPKPSLAPSVLTGLVASARKEAERIEVAAAHSEALEPNEDDESIEAAALQALAALRESEHASRPRISFSSLSDMPLGKQAIIGTALAAAVIFVGVISVAGMSYLLGPNATETAMDTSSEVPAAMFLGSDGQQSDEMAGSAAPESDERLLDSAQAEVGTAPDYVTFDGWVCRPSGASNEVDLAELEAAGTLRSDLGGDLEGTHPVWTSSSATTVYVQADNEELLTFELITRRLNGVAFGLRSYEVTRFGQWPGLPATIPAPTRADGTPTFLEQGTDDSGAPIYPKAGMSPTEGYAIAPFTEGVSASEGNPNWTWWEPAPTTR